MKKIFCLVIALMVPLCVNAETGDLINEQIVATETKYYKTITDFSGATFMNSSNSFSNSRTIEISEEEYNQAPISNNSILPLSATVETTYKKLKTTIETSGSQYRYKAILTWKNAPKVRSYDIFGIGFLPSVKIDGNISFSQTACKSGTCTTTTSFTSNITSTGCSAIFKLPSSEYVSIEQTMSFLVKKNTTANIISQVAAGDYSHATVTTTKDAAKKHTINESGLSLNTSIVNSYDTISTAKATWSGNW